MQNSKQLVAGLDEAGRGPLAGPVVAAAVVFLNQRTLSLPKDTPLIKLRMRDSKHLSEKRREEWYRLFCTSPHIQWGIGRVSEKIIDRINIYQATRLAMVRAVENLQKRLSESLKISSLVIDGNFSIPSPLRQQCVVRGDETVPLCGAASIIAKVTRDRLMLKYHKRYSAYGFDRHKGYGTPSHLAKLRRLGPCPLHRLSFHPCKTKGFMLG